MADQLKKTFALDNRDILGTYKKSGKRLCGYISNFIPVEMIHAAGMIPVRMESSLSIPKLADTVLPTSVCDHVRGCLEKGLSGEYDDLGGVVFTRSCDAVRNLYTIWANNVSAGFTYFLSTPGNVGPESGAYLFEELKRFRTFLHEQGPQRMTDDALTRSVRLYNRIRDRLRTLTLSGFLSGKDLFLLYQKAHIMEPGEFYDAISNLDSESGGQPDPATKVALTGSHFNDPEIVTAIEDLGITASVVDLDFGPRSFWLDVEEGTDPLKALADRYVKMGTLDPSKHPSEERIQLLLTLIDRIKIDGILVMNQKYCDPYLFEEPLMRRIFEEKGIPSLFVNIGERLEHKQQLINRIEAFIEILL